MAPKSSITANAVRNIFNDVGTFLPNSESIPIAKAMSVAIGIPKPDCVLVLKFKLKYKSAGTIIPPIAPNAGNIAFRNFESSPLYNSRSSSSPMSRKNTAIKKSLIQNSTEYDPSWVCQNDKYEALKTEFAIKSDIMVQKIKIKPPAFSLSKNELKIVVIFINILTLSNKDAKLMRLYYF